MVSVPVYNPAGKQTGEMEIDPAMLGGEVRPALLKQAIVAFQDHQRQHSSRTKGRSQVEGSTRKLYRQKGTGNARAGSIRTPVRRGGGRTFAKRGPLASKGFPKKMRRMARNNAILAKINSQDVLVIDGLDISSPKTKAFAAMLSNLGAADGCLFAIEDRNDNVYLSSRNLPRAQVRVVEEINAYEVLLGRKVIFTKEAFQRLCDDPVKLRHES
ncbi:MAG: 50S ribosomal protein L4 [Planctomycetota bacterium]|jgi:large subunit ribosomal protein L4